MRTTKQAKDVKEGDIVWNHGYKWVVRVNLFDPAGNTGDQPRQLFIADAVGDDPTLHAAYAIDMCMGFLPNANVTVEARP